MLSKYVELGSFITLKEINLKNCSADADTFLALPFHYVSLAYPLACLVCFEYHIWRRFGNQTCVHLSIKKDMKKIAKKKKET